MMWVRTYCKGYDSELVNLANIVNIHKRGHIQTPEVGEDERPKKWKIIAVDNSAAEGGGTFVLASNLTEWQADDLLKIIWRRMILAEESLDIGSVL